VDLRAEVSQNQDTPWSSFPDTRHLLDSLFVIGFVVGIDHHFAPAWCEF